MCGLSVVAPAHLHTGYYCYDFYTALVAEDVYVRFDALVLRSIGRVAKLIGIKSLREGGKRKIVSAGERTGLKGGGKGVEIVYGKKYRKFCTFIFIFGGILPCILFLYIFEIILFHNNFIFHLNKFR